MQTTRGGTPTSRPPPPPPTPHRPIPRRPRRPPSRPSAACSPRLAAPRRRRRRQRRPLPPPPPACRTPCAGRFACRRGLSGPPAEVRRIPRGASPLPAARGGRRLRGRRKRVSSIWMAGRLTLATLGKRRTAGNFTPAVFTFTPLPVGRMGTGSALLCAAAAAASEAAASAPPPSLGARLLAVPGGALSVGRPPPPFRAPPPPPFHAPLPPLPAAAPRPTLAVELPPELIPPPPAPTPPRHITAAGRPHMARRDGDTPLRTTTTHTTATRCCPRTTTRPSATTTAPGASTTATPTRTPIYTARWLSVLVASCLWFGVPTMCVRAAAAVGATHGRRSHWSCLQTRTGTRLTRGPRLWRRADRRRTRSSLWCTTPPLGSTRHTRPSPSSRVASTSSSTSTPTAAAAWTFTAWGSWCVATCS
mmetsp:Transcript_27362/g.86951  ORF Transcript_27362/g.86951 Transcript_27362/m.86951 type:complete len:419 (+) Transcript_27362:473-1729(+)